MQLISPSLGPLDVSQALQVLSDANANFAVIGICSAESSTEASVAAALGGLLSGQQQQAAPAAALRGLQLHVHPRDRLIVLDASHILSADVLAVLLAPDRPHPAVGSAAAAAVRAAATRAGSSSTIPVEGVASLLSLQTLVFLLAVCNVVVVAATGYDVQLLQLLEACCLVTSSIPDLAVPPAAVAQQQQQQGMKQPAIRRGRGQQQQQKPGGHEACRSRSKRQQQQQLLAPATVQHHLADLVLLQCCSNSTQLAGDFVMLLQQQVTACLSGSEWAARPLLMSQATPMSTAAVGAGDRQQDKKHQEQHCKICTCPGINVWVAPAIHDGLRCSSNDSARVSAGVADAQQLLQHQQRVSPQLQQLANKLLALSRTGSSGCFSKPLSEKDWLRGAQRVWEAVQDSTELLQYYSLAAVARYTGAGGWRQR